MADSMDRPGSTFRAVIRYWYPERASGLAVADIPGLTSGTSGTRGAPVVIPDRRTLPTQMAPAKRPHFGASAAMAGVVTEAANCVDDPLGACQIGDHPDLAALGDLIGMLG